MNKIVNFFVKSLSFDVFQLIVFNCEISMKFKFYEFCKKLKVFDCKDEFFNYWKEIIKTNEFIKNNEMLNYSKQTNFIKKLSKEEILEIINLFLSVVFYETFEYLLDFIELNEYIAYRLKDMFLYSLRTPNTKKQQQIQLEIYKKLMKYQPVKDYFNHNFDYVIESLNIPLVDFVIKEFDIKINELFDGYTVLQWAVGYLIDYPNENNEFAYEMFDYLLTIGADFNTNNSIGNDINFDINRIKDQKIQKDLFDKLLQFK